MTTKDTLLEPMAIVRQQTEAIQQSYQNYQNNPFSVEHVHSLRVNLRKLRALLNVLKPKLDATAYQEWQSKLREAGRVLSPVRDLDVLHAYCSNFALKEPTMSEAYPELFNYLGILRRREQGKTFNKTNQQIFNEMLASLTQLTSDRLTIDVKKWPTFLKKRLTKKTEKLKQRMSQVDQMTYDNLHQTRKQAKKIRYSASLLKNTTDQSLKQARKEAKHSQTELGKATDAHVIHHLLEKLSQEAPDKAVKELLLNIQSDKRN